MCRIATPWLQPAGLGEFVGEFVPPAVGDHGAQSLLAGGFQGETSGEPRSSALPAALCLSRLTGIDAERQSPHSRTEPQWHLHHCIVLRRPAWRQRRRSRELWFWGDGGSGGQPNGLPAARQRLCTGACVHASCLPACLPVCLSAAECGRHWCSTVQDSRCTLTSHTWPAVSGVAGGRRACGRLAPRQPC